MWFQPGMPVMVVPTLSKDEAAKLFKKIETKQLPSKQEYLRTTTDY